MGQKQQVHIKPLNQPTQQLKLCALSAQQLICLGHLKLQYEHDTMVVPFISSFRKIIFVMYESKKVKNFSTGGKN
jgi:hypothetical protein